MRAAALYCTTSALTSSWVRTFITLVQTAKHTDHRQKPMSAAERAIATDVKASLNGDGAAFARLIDRFQATIARRMTKFTRDPNALEELVHDVFVEAYTSLRNYRGEAPLEHWLQRIATRVGYRYWKQKSSVRTVS